jgi:hypothetical protein
LNDSTHEDLFAPGPLARELFYTDESGEPASPDDVIPAASFEAWEDLEPRALELLRDETAKPYDRFLACTALVTWGSADGYQAVQAAAADPASVPWLGYSVDRLYGVDDTFGLLGHAVAESREMAAERETRQARLDALASLAPLAPGHYLDNVLSPQGIYKEDMAELGEPLSAAVSASLAVLSQAPEEDEDPLVFDIPVQTAGMIAALEYADAEAARTYAAELVALAPDDERVLRALGDLTN